MKIGFKILCQCFSCALLVASLVLPLSATANTKDIRGIFLPFVEQTTQKGSEVRFTAQTPGGTAGVTADGRIVYTLPATDRTKACIIEETPVRDVPLSGVQGEGLIKAKATVFYGNAPKQTLKMFKGVSLGCITPGIDLYLKAYSNNMEKLYTIAPGADPGKIRMRMGRTAGLKVLTSGELEVMSANGPVRFTAPIAFQKDTTGKKQPVQIAYNALDNNEYGFSVGAYDKSRTLVIDPLLGSTYLGGTGDGEAEIANDIALDADGNIYVAGSTPSADFPVTDGITLSGTTDGFIAKFNSDLSELLAATFIGGTGYDYVWRLIINGSQIYAAGGTTSTDFPVTTGVYDTDLSGETDVFILIINTDLDTLSAATYIGGSPDDYYGYGGEQYPDLALSPGGDIFVAMETSALDFPMASPDGMTPYDSILSHSKNHFSDIAIARLSGDLTTLEASTFLGGSGSTYGYGYEHWPRIALDASGDVWIAGITGATDFPTTTGAFRQSIIDGGDYVFLSRLDADLTTLEASTYAGRSHPSWHVALAMGTGSVYVAGTSYTDEPWPVTPGAYDTLVLDTADKAFISRFSSDLSTLQASTLIGGTVSANEYPRSRISDMQLDSAGDVVVAGITACSNFPTSPDAYDTTADEYYLNYSYHSNPFFISRLDGDLETLSASTYLGNSVYGNHDPALALDDSDNVYLCGLTASSNFPTTQDAYDTSFASDRYNNDAFVSKLDSNLSRDTFADLALTTGADSLSVTTGGEITVTLTVGNQGPDAADAVVLTITLPDEMTFVSATPEQGTADHNAGVVTCEMDTIGALSEVSVSIVAQATSIGDYTGNASVSATPTDPNESNNTIDVTVSVTGKKSVKDGKNALCFIGSTSSPRFGNIHAIFTRLMATFGR